MKTAAGLLVAVSLTFTSVAAHAQLFNDGQPVGAWSVAVGPVKEGSWAPLIYGCAGGPNMMMAVASEGGAVNAIGPGYFVDAPWTHPVAAKGDFQQAAGGLSLGEIRALASSRDLATLYAGFQAYGDVGGQGGSPIFSFTLEGDVQVLIPVEEVNDAAGSPVSVMSIAPGAEGTLWVIVQVVSEPTRHLLRVDLSKPTGSRVESVLNSKDLVKKLDVPSGTVALNIYEMGNNLTADESGRAFFDANVEIANEETASVLSRMLMRLDPDGKVVELTKFEYSPLNETNSWGFFNYPAHGIWNGLQWDPDTGMLVGAGNGLWLIDPDVPHSAFPLMQPETVMGIAEQISPQNWTTSPHGAAGGSTCLARLEDGWFGTMMQAYFAFGYDLDFLDYDMDGLTGGVEKKRGTDPKVRDTDGGGISDGLEVSDFTDPLDQTDDRWFPQPSEDWTMSALYWGSAFQAGPGGGTIDGNTFAGKDGGLVVAGSNGPDMMMLYEFEGWDLPGKPLSVPAFHSPMVCDPKGNVYGLDYELKPGKYPVVRMAPDGTRTEVFPETVVTSLVGPEPVPTSWMVDPLGRVWVGYRGGKILRSGPDDTVELAYDGLADLVSVQYMKEDGTVPWGACSVEISVDGLLFEEVRGIVYFAFNRSINCAEGSGTSPLVAAFLPDGRIVRVVDIVDFQKASILFGGGDIVDLAPDNSGGIYVLMTHLLDRSLHRVDANWVVHAVEFSQEPSRPNGDSMSWSLGHASDITVLPDGRIFTVGATYYNQYPTYYGLLEIKPVDFRVRGGELLVVLPEEPFLGKLLPDGGGANLIWEEPLKRPVGVAATEDLVAVSDADLKGVLMFTVGADGKLQEPELVAGISAPAGLDIDAAGNVLVCDVAANRVVRIAPDGTASDAASGAPLSAPMDVVATGTGGFVVANHGGNALLHYDADGAVHEVASVDSPRSVVLLTGKGYAVSSNKPAMSPFWLVDGVAVPAMDPKWSADKEVNNAPGGIAAALDGTLFWFDSIGSPSYLPVPFKGMSYVWRISAQGTIGSLSRRNLTWSPTGGDLCRVRKRGEALPYEPGIEPPPPAGDDLSSGDSAAPGDGGTGCSAAGRGHEACALPLVLSLLVLAGLTRLRRTPIPSLPAVISASLLIALLCVAACSSSGGTADQVSGADDVKPSGWDAWGSDFSVWVPDVLEEQCKGKSLCPPGTGPECTGETAHHRCMEDEAGCWVWSDEASCLDGETCKDGLCVGPCVPLCAQFQECGDDGCGGSCGTCSEAGEVCCADLFCGACALDCTGKQCGHNGVGGSCGSCPEGMVCALGGCVKAGTGTCRQWYQCTECETWDDACWDDCGKWLDSSGKQAQAKLSGCAAVHCTECPQGTEGQACWDECLFTYCALEFAECFAQGGTKTCKQIYECTLGCEEGDQACIDECYFSASPYYLYYALTWEMCAEPFCSDKAPGSEMDQCLAEVAFDQCKTEFEMCIPQCNADCGDKECGPNDCLFSCGDCAGGMQCVEGKCQ